MKYYLCISIFLALQCFSFARAQYENNATLEAVQNGVTDFTIKLNKLLQEKNEKNEKNNTLFSPINIYAALALVHLGTNGTTQAEVSAVMGISNTSEISGVHQAIKDLLTSAQKKRKTRIFQDGEVKKVIVSSINFADGLFVQNGLPVVEKYSADVKFYYNSEFFGVDFMNKGDEATKLINQYVANKTENNIPQLYNEDLSSDTRIILVTALYFKSIWDVKFRAEDTKPDVFYSENGNITVDMMHRVYETPYADIPSLNLEAVQLYFAEKLISMYIIKPYENETLNSISENLTSEGINKIIEETENGKTTYVDLKLPRTTFKWSKKLNEELIRLGAKKIFTEQAELKNMVNEKNLKVTEVGHATDIKITEDGTEASAVTTIQLGLRSAYYSKKVNFHVNRPFLVLIYHHQIKSILFFGTVYNPNG